MICRMRKTGRKGFESLIRHHRLASGFPLMAARKDGHGSAELVAVDPSYAEGSRVGRPAATVRCHRTGRQNGVQIPSFLTSEQYRSSNHRLCCSHY